MMLHPGRLQKSIKFFALFAKKKKKKKKWGEGGGGNSVKILAVYEIPVN